MSYIFVGLLLGSIVTSNHDTREACEGRATVLKEKGVIGKCVEQNNNTFTITGSSIYLNSPR